jgi:hypothetical protein
MPRPWRRSGKSAARSEPPRRRRLRLMPKVAHDAPCEAPGASPYAAAARTCYFGVGHRRPVDIRRRPAPARYRQSVIWRAGALKFRGAALLRSGYGTTAQGCRACYQRCGRRCRLRRRWPTRRACSLPRTGASGRCYTAPLIAIERKLGLLEGLGGDPMTLFEKLFGHERERTSR